MQTILTTEQLKPMHRVVIYDRPMLVYSIVPSASRSSYEEFDVTLDDHDQFITMWRVYVDEQWTLED